MKKKPISTLWAMSAVLLTSPICLIFIYFGKPGAGRAAWFFSGVILISAKVRWELHNKVWFWGVLTTVVCLHLLLIFFVPWTAKWIPAAVIFPFCAVDCLIILATIQLVEKLSGKPDTSEEG